MVESETSEERRQAIRGDGGERTRLSPLSLVIFGGRPAGNACSNIRTSPCLAASYIREAKATISGDSGVGKIVRSPMATTELSS